MRVRALLACVLASITMAERFNQDLMQSGLYRSLGFYTGYYHYGEVAGDGSRIMRMDMPTFGLTGQLGVSTDSGLKLEGSAKFAYALGVYTGSILDVDNKERNGQRSVSITGALVSEIELKGGYNILKNSQTTSLSIQSGLGYFFTRTEFMPMDRLQGYLYVPLELEGELRVGESVLNYGAGYRYLVFGNHFSSASEYGVNGDLYAIQKKGFGLSAFIGRTYYSGDALRSLRLVYEYWHIGASKPLRTTSSVTGNPVAIYEPENSTHRLLLQYSYRF